MEQEEKLELIKTLAEKILYHATAIKQTLIDLKKSEGKKNED